MHRSMVVRIRSNWSLVCQRNVRGASLASNCTLYIPNGLWVVRRRSGVVCANKNTYRCEELDVELKSIISEPVHEYTQFSKKTAAS